MVCQMTKKESDLQRCAFMILRDQCPPDRKHYLCMVSEDCTGDCTQCWLNYLWDIGADIVKPSRKKKEAI